MSGIAAAETAERRETSALRTGAALGGIVLAAVFVFGLGVMVGKRVAESGPAVSPPPAALPTEAYPPLPAAPPPPAAAIPPESLTFYDRLRGAAPPAPLALPEGQAPPQAPPSTASAPGPAAPRETTAAAPGPKAAPAPPKATPAKAAATASVAKTPSPAKTDPGEQIRRLAGKGRYAVQVAAVNERAAAEEAASRVKRQGFEAVTVMASVKGKIWYRIRVGSFPSKTAAAQAAAIFRTAYGYNAVAVQN
jgi:cell division protein FtsN